MGYITRECILDFESQGDVAKSGINNEGDGAGESWIICSTPIPSAFSQGGPNT